jgi:hypothetical protein
LEVIMPAHCRMLLAVASVAALVSGCTAAPPVPIAGAHPADPSSPSRRAAYRAVIDAAASRRPADPLDWTEQNNRVAPGGTP